MQVPLLQTNDELKGIEVSVPLKLREVLEYNPHLVQKFFSGVPDAVQYSFNHPDTRLRGEVRQSEIYFRTRLCYQALVDMYDMGISLTQGLDTLPTVLVDAIRMGAKPGEVGETKTPGRWSVDAEAEEVIQEDANINMEGVS